VEIKPWSFTKLLQPPTYNILHTRAARREGLLKEQLGFRRRLSTGRSLAGPTFEQLAVDYFSPLNPIQ
jgi:hypothetical protein